MRFLLMIVGLTFSLPLEAARPDAPKAPKVPGARKVANKFPTRVLTFVCHDADNHTAVMGIANMTIDIRDSSAGAFAASAYFRGEKGYTTKNLFGSFTSVPQGYVLRTKMKGSFGEFSLLHLHPAEKSTLPGIQDSLSCEVSAELESI